LPWCFRKQKIGSLVGKRTWGGLVGIGGNPELTDGGTVTSPRWALYGLEGQWEVENIGIAPDVDVDLDPAAARQAHDSQLEKSIEMVMQLLKEHPLPEYKRPISRLSHEGWPRCGSSEIDRFRIRRKIESPLFVHPTERRRHPIASLSSGRRNRNVVGASRSRSMLPPNHPSVRP